jgi:CRISPR-associated protein Cas2
VDIWLVCYDISDDKRRNRLSSWLLRFGMRVQESVFELTLKDDVQFNRLWRGVESKIATGDSVRAYPIHQAALAGVRCLGSAAPENPSYATVL